METNNLFRDNAIEIWGYYINGQMLPEVTVSSTAESCISIIPQEYPPNHDPTILIPVYSMKQTVEKLTAYQKQGYVFNINDARRTHSLHKKYLNDAKSGLIMLMKEGIDPSIIDKAAVINASGDALNCQIDQHTKVFEKNIFGMPAKLQTISLPPYLDGRLYNKYDGLNPYYNASKHPQTVAHRDRLKKLHGLKGTKITIDYFETVRRIFIWYYKNNPGVVPEWEELEKIDYSQHGIYYQFLYKTRWI